MADRALVSIFFRQIAVGRTSCGFAGTILPRHIGQSGSRAGFHAFRFAVAEEALAGFLFFAVEAHHVPRTGFLAESAADALVFIHIAGAGLGIDVDGTLRAGIGAGDRVSALAARVLIDGAVAPDALQGTSARIARTVPNIAADTNTSQNRIVLTVVKFGTSHFAALAVDAERGIADD